MKQHFTIAVIARSTDQFTHVRWSEEAKKSGTTIVFFDPMECAVMVGSNGKSKIISNNAVVDPSVDAVFRVASFTESAYAIEQHYIQQGAKHLLLAEERPIRLMKGKFFQYQKLALANIPIPTSFLIHHASMVEQCMTFFDHTFPLIVKAEVSNSTQGIGIMIAESKQSLQAIVEFSLGLHIPVIVQEFIAENSGTDYRVIVLQDQIIGAILRDNRGKDFRSNVARGGKGMPVVLTQEQEEIALRATRAEGSIFAGVDLLGSPTNPIVTEVNNPCRFEEFEKVTGKNVVAELIHALITD